MCRYAKIVELVITVAINEKLAETKTGISRPR